MCIDSLRTRLAEDRASGRLPFLVVATAGSVSTGVIDPVRALADLCQKEDLWLHADGAYGAPAAVLPDAPDDLHALSLADSVAMDPHKWLYCPIEAACVITKHERALQDAFGFYPDYYLFDEREGYCESIRDDIQLAELLYALADAHEELSAHSINLSIATFRYVPADIIDDGSEETESYLNRLNQALLAEIQAGGELYLSNAIVDGKFLLRGCIVNFRTSQGDIEAIPEMVVDIGRRNCGLRPVRAPLRLSGKAHNRPSRSPRAS
jgi:glutamate/tyrosine decarboxylase-like PLP-dependent enzyme